jgi:hypothetical protein
MLTLYVIINFSSSLVTAVASPWEFEIFTPALAAIVTPKAPPPLNIYEHRSSEVQRGELTPQLQHLLQRMSFQQEMTVAKTLC